jgi:hypothetical protein
MNLFILCVCCEIFVLSYLLKISSYYRLKKKFSTLQTICRLLLSASPIQDFICYCYMLMRKVIPTNFCGLMSMLGLVVTFYMLLMSVDNTLLFLHVVFQTVHFCTFYSLIVVLNQKNTLIAFK